MPNNFPAKAQQMKQIARTIRTMDRRADDLTSVWRKVGSRIARGNSRQFSTKGAYYGTPWKPLAASTQAQKLRQGWPRAPLVRTRAMKLSFTGRPMGIEIYRAHSATFGSDLKRSVWQQEGTRRNGKRHIPPRVMMKVSRELRSDIHKFVVEYITRNKL